MHTHDSCVGSGAYPRIWDIYVSGGVICAVEADTPVEGEAFRGPLYKIVSEEVAQKAGVPIKLTIVQ